MRKLAEIQELKTWLIDTYHSIRKTEQETDDTYYWDTFKVPYIKDPYQVRRMGTGFRLVDVPANDIITSEPKVYVEAITNTKGAMENAIKRGILLNHWARALLKQNPQPYKEVAKNQLVRGEAWIHPVNNPGYNGDNLPIHFAVPDPLVIFASPDERDGIPDYVIVSYSRYFQTVLNRYEHWSNPKNAGKKGNSTNVSWLEYWDKDIRYFEADGEPVLVDDKGIPFNGDGIQPNILGITPFIHCYSGYGKASPDGKPETLAVSRIRLVRELILAQTEMFSDVSSELKLFSHRRLTFTPTEPNAARPTDFVWDDNYASVNWTPWGFTRQEDKGEQPSAETYAFLAGVGALIDRNLPPVLSGISSGTSGRQEDILGSYGTLQYKNLLDNATKAFGTAFGMGLKILKIPALNLFPVSVRGIKTENGVRIREEETITAENIDDFECEVELRASNPMEDERRAMLGDREQLEGIIDWRTNLMEFKGKSLDEAEEIINRTLADRALMSNPMLLQAITMRAMQKLGMQQELQAIQAQGQTEQAMKETAGVPTNVPGVGGRFSGPPRQGNVQSSQALDLLDQSLAQRQQRRSPSVQA